MRALARMRRRFHEIAAQLADVLEQRAVVGDHLVPEFAGGKFFADEHRAAGDQRRADGDDPAGGVVHRQAVVHAVIGARVHHAAKATGRKHDPIVVDVGGLRHARGAGGVDEQRLVLDGEVDLFRDAERPAVERGNCEIDTRMVAGLRAGIAVQPDLRRGFEKARGRYEGGEALRRDDHVPRCDDVDAIGERSAGETGVEECDRRSGAGEPEPDREILRPVRHQQRHHVALGDALLQGPAQVAAGPFGERPVAQGFARGYQRGLVAVGVGELVDDDRKNAARVAHDRRSAPQRAHPGAEISQVARQPFEHKSSCAARVRNVQRHS